MKSHRITALSLAAAAILAGCGGSSASNNGGSSAASPSPAQSAPAVNPAVPAGAVMVTLEDFDIMPATLTVKTGHVVFYVKNVGKTPHNFTLVDASGKAVAGTPNINQGEARVLEADVTAAASKYICTQPGHRSLGMEGTLTIG